jgi:tryptophan synthase alpha chain
MIEIGFHLVTHLADGPTIQESSTAALHNGNTQTLFDQLLTSAKNVKYHYYHGYFNRCYNTELKFL